LGRGKIGQEMGRSYDGPALRKRVVTSSKGEEADTRETCMVVGRAWPGPGSRRALCARLLCARFRLR
jgi:hypothetical protein